MKKVWERKEMIQKRAIKWIEEEGLWKQKIMVINNQKKKSKKVGIASQ